MSYKPSISTPIFFAHNSSDQTINTDTKLTLDTSLYAGSLSSNNLNLVEKNTSIADVRYTMSSTGLRSVTIIRAGNNQSVSEGFNVHGGGGASTGASDEIAYATFDATALNIFCDTKHANSITLTANFTRLTGALIS